MITPALFQRIASGMKWKTVPLLFFIMSFSCVFAQEKKTLEACEEQFLSHNLYLLAAQYRVDATRAQAIQAAIWELPYAVAEINAYNPQQPRWLDAGRAGQKVFSVQQLILLGGKRRKEVAWAENETKLSELEFTDLLRNLRFELRKAYFSLWTGGIKLENTENQLARMDTLAFHYQIQAQKGNTSYKDLLRLQALMVRLRQERLEIINEQQQFQETLKLLTRSSQDIVPQVSDSLLLKFLRMDDTDSLELTALQELALKNRPDYEIARLGIRSEELFLRWQKSLTIPDLTVGAVYDQRGGAFDHQTNITLGIPLPLWNKNRGNIRMAEAKLSEAQTLFEQEEQRILMEIARIYNRWNEAGKNYRALSKTIDPVKNDEVYLGMILNFQNRNVGIMEFTDFVESYNESRLNMLDMSLQYILSCEELNTATNTLIF